MLLQTNSYFVPKEKRAEHARLMRRFRQALAKLGCDMFEVYEQVGANWTGAENGRYVQIMRFRDRKHQVAVQNAERTDPAAQALIAEFCELVNFQYQQQQGLFAVGFYNSTLPLAPVQVNAPPIETASPVDDQAMEQTAEDATESAPLSESGAAEDVESLAVETESIADESIDELSEQPTGAEESPFETALEPLAEEESAPAEETPTESTGGEIELQSSFDALAEPTTEDRPLSEDELLGELSSHAGSNGNPRAPESATESATEDADLHHGIHELADEDTLELGDESHDQHLDLNIPPRHEPSPEHDSESEPTEAAPQRTGFFRRRPRR